MMQQQQVQMKCKPAVPAAASLLSTMSLCVSQLAPLTAPRERRCMCMPTCLSQFGACFWMATLVRWMDALPMSSLRMLQRAKPVGDHKGGAHRGGACIGARMHQVRIV